MVKITIYHREREFELFVTGHATGSPEVCAAVSGIVTALAGWMENNREHLDGSRTLCRDLTPGDACILFTGDAYAETAFSVAEIGLAQIAQSWPQYAECAWYEEQ